MQRGVSSVGAMKLWINMRNQGPTIFPIKKVSPLNKTCICFVININDKNIIKSNPNI